MVFVEKAHGEYNRTIPSVQVVPAAAGPMQNLIHNSSLTLERGKTHLRLIVQAQMSSGASEKLQQEAEWTQKGELTFRTTRKVSKNSGFFDTR